VVECEQPHIAVAGEPKSSRLAEASALGLAQM
jgi:hypothetical protein